MAGLEPARVFSVDNGTHWIPSPARLPVPPHPHCLMGLGSLELPTFRLATRRSIRLSYRPKPWGAVRKRQRNNSHRPSRFLSPPILKPSRIAFLSGRPFPEPL